MTAFVDRENPYVGLPPFDRGDARYFFGRRTQTIELLDLLHRTHLLGIVGSSGCGKSSLVRAGLIPALLGGFLVANRDSWRIAVMRPGRSPLRNLAAALLGAEREPTQAEVDQLEACIAETQVTAVLNLLRSRLGSRTNLLLLVDQFEEIFFYREGTDPDSRVVKDSGDSLIERHSNADEFVALLLALVSRRDLPIYTVLTMRSDFLGDCDIFPGLPEAMNASRYLVPRLTRDQLRDAIEGPALVKGASVAPRLLDRLLNELGERSDQLPVMQHALRRTWHGWSQRGAEGPLDQGDYDQAGTLAYALERHADEAMSAVNVPLATRIFKRLTATDPQGRRVRSPTTLRELALSCTVSELQVLEVLQQFQADGRHFVSIEGGTGSHRRVDISHESLIRQWSQLSVWVDEERDARDRLLDLVQRALRWQRNEAGLLTGVDLGVASGWWKESGPKQGWSRRYCSEAALDLAFRYLLESEHRFRRARRAKYITVAAAFVGLLVLVYQTWQARTASQELAVVRDKALTNEKLVAQSRREYGESVSTVAKLADRLASMEKEKAEAAYLADLRVQLEWAKLEALEAKKRLGQTASATGLSRPTGGGKPCNCPAGDPLCSCL